MAYLVYPLHKFTSFNQSNSIVAVALLDNSKIYPLYSVMVWCFYYLAIHPEIQEKVYQELLEVLGEEEITPQITSDLK